MPIQLVRESVWNGVSDDSGVLVNGSYDQLSMDATEYETILAGSDGSAQSMPQGLETALETLNETIRTNADDTVAQYQEMAEGDPNPRPEDGSDAYYVYHSSLYVQRADSTVLSVLSGGESYTHGAHGWTSFTGYSYDMSTGEEISLEDCFEDTTALTELVAMRAQEQFPDALAEDLLSEPLDNYLQKKIDDPEENGSLAFTFGPSGMTFWFSAGDLASYAAGSMGVTLTYDELDGMLPAEYIPEEPMSAIQGIPSSIQVAVPDGDSTCTILSASVYPGLDGEGYDTGELGAYIEYGDMTKELTAGDGSIAGYEGECFLVTDGEDHYLLINAIQDNDWESVYSLDLDTGTLTSQDGEITAGLFGHVPLDPGRLVMGTRTQVLGTTSVASLYQIGSSGKITGICDWYAQEDLTGNGYSITLKEDLEAQVGTDIYAAPESLTLEKQTIEAGTKLQYYRTDGICTADFLTADRKIVRIMIDSLDSYPQTVDGTSVDTLFDGIIFAG